MKSQSFKLFAVAVVLGLVMVFASANSANAQEKMSFNVPFDFHIGSEKLSAGKYDFQKIGERVFLMRNAATGKSRAVYFESITDGKAATNAETLVFNRYAETYFLNSLFDVRNNPGRRIIETKYEKKVRKGMPENEDKLAGKRQKSEQVSVNSNRR
jgi:hypothetical protein